MKRWLIIIALLMSACSAVQTTPIIPTATSQPVVVAYETTISYASTRDLEQALAIQPFTLRNFDRPNQAVQVVWVSYSATSPVTLHSHDFTLLATAGRTLSSELVTSDEAHAGRFFILLDQGANSQEIRLKAGDSGLLPIVFLPDCMAGDLSLFYNGALLTENAANVVGCTT